MSRTCPKCSGKLFVTVTAPPKQQEGDKRDLISFYCGCKVAFQKTSKPMAAFTEFYNLRSH